MSLSICENPQCNIQFADSLNACPVCGTPRKARDYYLEAVTHSRDIAAADTGQIFLLTLFAMQIVVNLFLIFGFRILGLDSRSNITLVRLIVEVGMMLAIYNGGEVFRTFWVFSAMLGVALAMPSLFGPAALPMLAFLLFQIYSIYVLRFNSAVSAFLQRQSNSTDQH